jgi:hypothetical protein
VNRKKITRVAGLATVGLLLTGSLAACGTSPGSDMLVIRYDKSSGGGQKFKECVQPNTRGGTSYNDPNIPIPASIRTWNIRADGAGDSKTPIQTGTKPDAPVTDGKGAVITPAQPGPDVVVYTQTSFYINTDCSAKADSPVVRFWQTLGNRYQIAKPTTDDEPSKNFNIANFRTMLQATLVSAEEKALRTASRQFDADDLDTNTGGVWGQLEGQMSNEFTAALAANLGGSNFFCGPEYKRDAKGNPVDVQWTEQQPDPVHPGQYLPVQKHGTCPPVRIAVQDINFADSSIAQARAAAYAAQQQARAQNITAQAQVDVANKLKGGGPEAAKIQEQQLELQKTQEQTKQVQACASSGARCVVVVGGNGNVNVGTGQ